MNEYVEADNEEDIQCPYCGNVKDDFEGNPVTYWGSDGSPTFMLCEVCDGEFEVYEDVNRTYRTKKLPS